MRSFTTFITAAAFVLHFVFGCQAHHAQADENGCWTQMPAAMHLDDGNCDESKELAGGGPVESDSKCPRHEGDDCYCVFMAAGKIVLTKATFSALLPFLLAETAPLGSIGFRATAALDSGGRIELPVRLHLFHQVLLI